MLCTKCLLDGGHVHASDVVDITGLGYAPEKASRIAQNTADKLLKNVEMLDQLGFGLVDLSSVDTTRIASNASPRGIVADIKFPQDYIANSGLTKIMQLHDVSQSLDRFGSHFSDIAEMSPLHFVSAGEELEELITQLSDLKGYLASHGNDDRQVQAVASAMDAAAAAAAAIDAEFEIHGSTNIGASIEKVLGAVAELSGPFEEMGHVFHLPMNFDLLKDIDLAMFGDGSFSLRGNIGGRFAGRKSVLGSLASMTGT